MVKNLGKLWRYCKKERNDKITNGKISTAPNILFSSLDTNLSVIKQRLQNGTDVVFREFTIAIAAFPNAVLTYIDGILKPETINITILKPLMFEFNEQARESGQADLLKVIKDVALPNSKITTANLMQDLIDGILAGNTALIVDGFSEGLLIDTKGWEARGVEEPDTEVVVRGPREGFTENIGVNTALLRRKIKDENLCLESLVLGKRSKTLVYIAYLRDVADEQLVTEVKNRLKRIDIDAILESGYIEQLIEDAPTSVFATVGNTEKPDVLAAKILEGRVGILIDGTPFALSVPYLLVEAFQISEDYYSRPYYASVVRALRLLSFLISILLPSLYVSLSNFHQEMVPTVLLIGMTSAREGIPFPAYVEVLGMGLIFEILREAGVRLPRAVGQAVSIVGALVLGQAAVEAGIVSNIMVMIVALTAIAGFVVPALTDVISLLRLFFLIWSSAFGLFGLLMGLLLVYIHLAKLRSFGVPYLAPIAPGNTNDLKDVFLRAPIWSLTTRPKVLSRGRSVRQNAKKPSPESTGNE